MDLNIHLRLDAATQAKVHAAAAGLVAAGADADAVDVTSLTSAHAPHVTLLLGAFTGDAAAVAAALARALAARPPVAFALVAGPPHHAGRYAFWNATGADLAALAAEVVAAAQPVIARTQTEPSWLPALPEAERAARRAQLAEYGTANSFEFYRPHVTLAYHDDAAALGAILARAPPLARVDATAAEIHVAPLAPRGAVPRASASAIVALAGDAAPD